MSERVVIVTGSREWPFWTVIHRVLDHVAPTLVVHGACWGADTMAAAWAIVHEVAAEPWPATWRRPDGSLDRGAGHARNRRMLEAHPGALVLAFPHPTLPSPGTRGCMKLAEELGHPLRVYDIEGELIHRTGPK